MDNHNEMVKQEKQPRSDKLKFFLFGVVCMLVIVVITFGVIWSSGGFTNQADSVNKSVSGGDAATQVDIGKESDSGGLVNPAVAKSEIESSGIANLINSANRIESGGFTSPEDAVRAYLDGYKKIDIEKMLSAFAVETFVEQYSFEAQVVNDVTYSSVLIATLAYPNSCKLLARDNIYQRIFHLERDISDQVMGFAEPDFSAVSEDDFGRMEQNELIDAVIGMFPVEGEFETLPSLSIDRFLESEEIGIDSGYDDPSVIEFMNTATRTYGIDDLRDVAVSCDIGGQGYYLTFTAYQYGDKWFLGAVGGTGGMSLPDGQEIIKGLFKR